LTDFVAAQLNYYNSCSEIMHELSKQVGSANIKSLPLAQPLTGAQQSGTAGSSSNGGTGTTSTPTTAAASAVGGSTTAAAPAVSGSGVTFFSALNGDDAHPSLLSKKQAKVLFDYEATDPSEISVSANQVIYFGPTGFSKIKKITFIEMNFFFHRLLLSK
jgi:hypothetical protein